MCLFYPIKIGIKKRSHEQNKKEKKEKKEEEELIQHNVTYKKLNFFKKKTKRERG